MHTLPESTRAIIQARADRCTALVIALQFLEKAIHPAEIEIWKNCKERITLEQVLLRADACRSRQVAKERWDNAERGTETEYVWANRYLDLTNPLLRDEILACENIDTALNGWKSTEKTDPTSTIWYRRLSELQEKDALIRADYCTDFSEAGIEYKNAEPDTKVSTIWFERYIALRYK
jgi:hypothetical protein